MKKKILSVFLVVLFVIGSFAFANFNYNNSTGVKAQRTVGGVCKKGIYLLVPTDYGTYYESYLYNTSLGYYVADAYCYGDINTYWYNGSLYKKKLVWETCGFYLFSFG